MFFQLPFLPEIMFSMADWAVYKKLMSELGTPIDEIEDTLIGFGARENPDTIHYAINWYRFGKGGNIFFLFNFSQFEIIANKFPKNYLRKLLKK